MEVVRFLEKNSERYSIDKKLVYSKTVDAFKARVSVTKFEFLTFPGYPNFSTR